MDLERYSAWWTTGSILSTLLLMSFLMTTYRPRQHGRKALAKDSTVPRSLFGGKNFFQPRQSPEDGEDGNGTYTATMAAGNRITGISINDLGLANGTVSRTAPSVHIVVYKVCGHTDQARRL
jgi:hypothetical protein